MGCVLKISGTNFNVDSYLSKTNWEDLNVRAYHEGEKRSPTGRFAPFEDSGFSILASEAEFEDFEQQQRDVIALSKNSTIILNCSKNTTRINGIVLILACLHIHPTTFLKLTFCRVNCCGLQAHWGWIYG
jgi:hypothetical protein